MEALKALLAQISTFWAGKDKRFKRNAIIIAASVLAVVILASVLLNQVDYAVLYSGLNSEDAAAVIDALKTQKVTYKVSGDEIQVPAADRDRLRMSLSTEVKKGFSLDILQQGNGLGVTDAQRKVLERYQLQLDIENALRTFEGVKDAKVTLTTVDDSVFQIGANGQKEATAGVIITFKDGFEANADNVRALASFVQKSVPHLTLENISMMDSTMRTLDTTDEKLAETTAKDQLALQTSVQSRLRQQVINLLAPVFGYEHLAAAVNVELNFDDKTTESVEFQPVVGKEGIAVSMDSLKEQIVNGVTPAATSAAPGTNTNTGTPTYPTTANAQNGTYEKNAETINYEVNSIKTTLRDAKGTVRNLSVSVVIDSTGLKDTPTDSVKDLIAKAVGVSTDLVAVDFMPMASTQAQSGATAGETAAQQLQSNQQMRFYIVVGAVVLVLLVAMMLVFLGRKPKAKALPEARSAVPAFAGAAEGEDAVDTDEELPEPDESDLASISIVRDNSAKDQIGKLIEKNPELVANLLRTWMSDEQE